MKNSVLFWAFLFLTGCAMGGGKQDSSNIYSAPPVGSNIELKTALTVPGGETRVYLQRGVVVTKKALDRYYPSCNFELKKLSETDRTIQPEAFLVVRVQPQTSEIVYHPQPLQLAGLRSAGMDGSGRPMIMRALHLWIGSDRQPDVRRLTCRGGLDDMAWASPPSIDAMRQALGGYASLILP